MFYYPEFDKDGQKILTEIDGINSNMLMDISVFKMKEGDVREFVYPDKEVAVLLTEGKIKITAEGVNYTADRKSVFDDLPTVIHCPKGKKTVIEAFAESEIIRLAALNDKDFPVKLYEKSDIICTTSSEGIWENVAVRDVNTVFDYDNAPYSKLVVGEVIARQGRWWSYVPHGHPQPEVYYYKYGRPEGFGACFIDDKAYTVKDGSYGCFADGASHVQVTAPCFPEYCCWMIRHLDGNPWRKTRTVNPAYKWIEDDLNKINYRQFK